MNINKIEFTHREVINFAIEYMLKIKDYEHEIGHIKDVVLNIQRISENINVNINEDVLVVSSYWHDVGRVYKNIGHEKLSAKLLSKKLCELGYSYDFIDKCYKTIEFHRWDMEPRTIEGIILKDANKLAFLGKNRWIRCIENKKRLDNIVELLPKLKNDILKLNISKELYDKDIISLVKLLHNYI